MSRITAAKLLEKKKNREPIVMLTAYDYPFAKIVDEAGVDAVLVGDSLGMVVLGYETTLGTTLDDVTRHTQAAARACRSALLIADMPFLSYQINDDETVRNAGRLVREGGAQAVKLEGGKAVVSAVRRITAAGIPVMGHLGLTPQSIHALGGYKVQGKSPDDARRILEEAEALQAAGCFSLVLECVPEKLGEEVSKRLEIPVIGIGAGRMCDGQVLVLHDLLGLTADHSPKFAKRFADLKNAASEAVRRYAEEVRTRAFPSQEHTFQ